MKVEPSPTLLLAVAVARSRALGVALVRRGSHVPSDLHTHERLREHSYALLAHVRVVLHPNLAQQLLGPILNLSAIVSSCSVDWSLPKEPHGGRLHQRPCLLHTYADTTPDSHSGCSRSGHEQRPTVRDIPTIRMARNLELPYVPYQPRIKSPALRVPVSPGEVCIPSLDPPEVKVASSA